MLIAVLIIWIVLMIIEWRRHGALFNPFTMESYFVVGFMILPQLIMMQIAPQYKINSFYSDLVILVFIVSIFIGTRIGLRTFNINGIVNAKTINGINLVIYALLILPIVPIFIEAYSIRTFYETVVFSKYAMFFDLSKLVLYFLIFFNLIRKQKFTLTFFILFPLVFLYGSRFVILDAILYLCVFLEQFRNLSFAKLALVGVFGAASIGLFTISQFKSSDIEGMFTSYFDIYRNQSYLIEELIEGNRDYYYGEIQFSSFLKYIPRILWEEKPKAYGFAILNYDIYPESARLGYMPSFGLGSTFADFGFFSIVAVGLMTGFVKNYFYQTFLKSKNNLTFFLYVLPFSFISTIFLLFFVVMDFAFSSARLKRPDLDSQIPSVTRD
jgi:hypothetical protein